jgi:hypothetical protein
MRTFIGAVLSVIAVGVMLIAYGLLTPRTTTADSSQLVRAPLTSARFDTDGIGQLSSTPRLQLRCEPGQRAILREVAGSAAAECADDLDVPARASLAYRTSDSLVVDRASEVHPARASYTSIAPRRPPARVERRSTRNWTKTAMVIGGSSAAGAGIGAIFGGKKGALIGAALAGGAGTLYEVKH